MAWEWSHTPEAYANARENLQEMDPVELRIMWAEWKATSFDRYFNAEFDPARYDTALEEAQVLGPVRLAGDIWTRVEELRTATNGGWKAYGCPYGCGPHLISFDREGS